jgi:hypothetical protein
MSGVSGRVSVPQRRDAREAIYEPPDRSLWLYIWEFQGWNQDQSVSDLLSCLREDPLTDLSKFSLTEFPNIQDLRSKDGQTFRKVPHSSYLQLSLMIP